MQTQKATDSPFIICRKRPREISDALQDEQTTVLFSWSVAISVRRPLSQVRRPLSQFVERGSGGGGTTVRPFPRDRGGGSDVKHDRDDIPENCARWSGKWMSFGRFVCELVSL